MAHDGFRDVRSFVQANLHGSSLETLMRLVGDPPARSKLILALGLPHGQELLPALIASVRTMSFHRVPTVEDLSKSAKVLAQLQSIGLKDRDGVTDAVLGEIVRRCPRLRSINLSKCKKVTDVGVGALAKHCPHLHSINLGFCDKDS